MPVGTPFLISPGFEYDVELNQFFYSTEMLAFRMSTRLGYARDLKAFLTFLHRNRGGVGWRDAREEDHRAYLVWRREDPAGPRVAGSTWDRELSGVNRFFRWQVSKGLLNANPIPQRVRRGTREPGRQSAGETAASYSHSARRERIRWLPARSYRLWRDVGVRGYRPDGLRDPGFRGRWAARNAVFVDLMVRTGMRLTEQASLTPFELPRAGGGRGGYQRFWLPAAVAKAGSARWVYVPSSVVRDLAAYAEVDRQEVIASARAKGRYGRRDGQFLVVERGKAVASVPGRSEKAKVSELMPEERARLFVEGPDGLEPAAFWLSEDGMPMSVSTWKDLFRQANERCLKHGLALHAYAHLLRHTFAVLTLEQLQRGHIAALAHLNPAQRSHYTRVFGDPLDWVRRRLGHKSATTTQVYLHALEELEMETRMALVPHDLWEDPRDPRLLLDSGVGMEATA